MAKKIISIPAAARTFNALRDLGYNMNSAVADIIDNSISRGKAKNIFIFFIKSEKRSFTLRILDDGCGMSNTRLEEAMRLGSSDEDYHEGDLSKYGMGLKTASLSQCHRLTVLSKRRGLIGGFQWDMHHIKKANEWELFKLSKVEVMSLIQKCKNQYDSKSNAFDNSNWTLVMWDDFKDFQTDYDSYNSPVTADNFYHRTLDELKLYLRLIFGRFLSAENKARKTNIYFNGTKLTAFDPFCRDEKATLEMELSKTNGHFLIDGCKTPVVIRRYILPAKVGQHKFSSNSAWAEAKGVVSWNDAQGYYVYRNNRLINFGGWFGTKGKDEHDKLARASIDLTDEHDSLFTLDVKKTKVHFPEALKNHLIDHVNRGFVRAARQRYDGERSERKVLNNVRNKSQKVEALSDKLVTGDHINVRETSNGDSLIINNKKGRTIVHDMTYRTLTAGIKFVSKRFSEKTFFWKMVPNPDNSFQVLINESHPFYDEVYREHEKNKKITAIADAFLFTMSFIELKCITKNNELLFEEIREVASEILKKFVEDKIL